MRSKALPPARAQGHIVRFLEAAALFAALCIFARTAALMLAAAITAPLPMAETLFWLGRQSAQEQPASSVQVEAAPGSTPDAAASSLPQAVQALTGNIEDYLVPLLGEEARPADAGTVIEKNYPQGSGEKYIPCGAGSIKNNTRQTAADIAAAASACEDAGADGVSLINTLPGMRIDLARRRPLLANRTGGMSGPGMFPLAVRMVYQVYEAVRIPIVGMGGVTSAQDVLELMLAGATAVGVGAANLVETYACKHIIETLPDAMARFGIDDLRDIIGGAHHG